MSPDVPTEVNSPARKAGRCRAPTGAASDGPGTVRIPAARNPRPRSRSSQAGGQPSRVRHVPHPVISTRARHCPTTESLGNPGFIEALDIAFRGVEPGLERTPNRVPEIHRHLG